MKRTAILVVALGVIGLGASSAMALSHSDSCAKCHVPHNAGEPGALAIPLWNPIMATAGTGVSYTTYESAKFNYLNGGSRAGTPDGASKVCLACHDGTNAASGITAGSPKIIKPEDLGRTHPVSFVYDSAMAARSPDKTLRDPGSAMSNVTASGTIAADLLDGNSKMQCTSCHDIHMSGNGTNHLRWTYSYDPVSGNDGSMCRVCHLK